MDFKRQMMIVNGLSISISVAPILKFWKIWHAFKKSITFQVAGILVGRIICGRISISREEVIPKHTISYLILTSSPLTTTGSKWQEKEPRSHVCGLWSRPIRLVDVASRWWLSRALWRTRKTCWFLSTSVTLTSSMGSSTICVSTFSWPAMIL